MRMRIPFGRDLKGAATNSHCLFLYLYFILTGNLACIFVSVSLQGSECEAMIN